MLVLKKKYFIIATLGLLFISYGNSNNLKEKKNCITNLAIIEDFDLYTNTTPQEPVIFGDTDNDGVPDDVDLDDDNDGILDVDEKVESDYSFDEAIERGETPFTNCQGSSDPPSANQWGEVVTPFSGNLYIGFHEPEIFNLELPSPMGINQVFTLGIATAIGSITPWGSNFPTQITIYAGTASCIPTQLIGTTTWRPNQAAGWLYEEISFTPSNAYTHLIFIADSIGNGFNPGVSTGYILIDGLNFRQSSSISGNADDIDSDTIPNYLDLDSDNDGISDLFESGVDASLFDPDSNGVIDGAQFVDANNNGLADSIEALNGINTGSIQIDSDGDGTPDVYDLDSDDDGIPDTIEAFPTVGYINNDGDVTDNDADGDGIIDLFDTNDTTSGIFGGNFIRPQNTDFSLGLDQDTIPDYLDTDSDGDGLLDALEGGNLITDVTYADPNGNINIPLTDLLDDIIGNTEVAYREYCILPSIDRPEDIRLCNAYTLPLIANGSYYTGPLGTGDRLDNGTVITTSRTLYIYAENSTTPNCTAEHSFEINIINISVGSIGYEQTICFGATPQEIIDLTATIADGPIAHQWQSSTNGSIFNNIDGETSTVLAPPPLQEDTWYRRIDTSTLNGTSCSVQTNTLKITVLKELTLPLPTLTFLACDLGANANAVEVYLDSALISGGSGTYVRYEFFWDNATPGDTTDDTLLQEGDSPSYIETSLDQRRILVKVYDIIGCSKTTEILLPQRFSLAAEITLVRQELCTGDDNGSITIDVQGGTPPYSTSINSGNGDFVTDKFLFEGLKGGKTYLIQVRDAMGCSVDLQLKLDSAVDLSALAEISYFCEVGEGQPMNEVRINIHNRELLPDLIFALDGDFVNGQVEHSFHNVAAGEHTISILYKNGCSRDIVFTVDEILPLSLTLTEPGINAITATASDGLAPYVYRIGDRPFAANNSFTITRSGDYLITVRDALGCEVSVTMYIAFLPIIVPNFFTPDGNGINDGWMPLNLEQYPDTLIHVYDRYGRLLAKLRPGQSWPGIYEDSDMPSGDYWYIITFQRDDGLKNLIGNFSLYR